MTIYKLLYEHAAEQSGIINTHSHHRSDDTFANLTLYELLKTTYISWMHEPYPDTMAGRKEYIESISCNSYFRWMAQSLGDLYGNGKPLTLANWDAIDKSLQRYYRIGGRNIEILSELCRYKAVIVDDFNNPGSDMGHPEIFRPTYRTDMFLYGYEKEAYETMLDPVNPFAFIGGSRPETLTEYIAAIKQSVADMKAKGCVALKSAIAYKRGIDFCNVNAEQAAVAYEQPNPTAADIKAFQDFIMFRLSEIAAEQNMPFQIHTGLGGLYKTNALQLLELISANPKTKFVLFHCGYPWMDDILALLHNFRNVYPDLCWLPLISPTAAVRFIQEAIDVGDSRRLCWGCDTQSAEESLGALLAIRHVLAQSLSEMCGQNILSINEAKDLISGILSGNAERLYFAGAQ